MYQNLKYESTVDMTRADWLAARKGSIGGSEAAAIAGLSPWSSPYSVWAEKTGRLSEKPDSEAMRQGRDLEAYVAARFSEATGKSVRRRNAIIRNPDIPFAHANVDRLIVGEDAGLECKTTSALSLKAFAGGEYPATYYVQCMHYMMVTGAAKWYLAVLVLGREFLWFEIPRDEAEIEALRQQEEAFWACVTTDTPPAVDGSEATSDAIGEIYQRDDGSAIDLGGVAQAVRTYVALKQQVKDLKAAIGEQENIIKSYMGDAAKGRLGGIKVSWSSFEASRFDQQAFIAAHPGMDLTPWSKTSTRRTFVVSGKE